MRNLLVARRRILTPLGGAVLASAAAGCGSDGPVAPADSVAPQLSIEMERITTNQPPVSIEGSVTDSVGVTRITYRVNGGAEEPVAITPGRTLRFVAVVPVSAELSSVEFFAYDRAGNRGRDSLGVHYDVKPPEFRYLSPEHGAQFATVLNLSGGAADLHVVERVTYSVNGAPERAVGGGYASRSPGVYMFNTSVSNLPMGQSTIVVYAYDWMGNRAQRQMTVTRTQ